MAINFYPFTALIGGGAGALDKQDGAGLADGDGAMVIISNNVYWYLLDATSGSAESSPEIISPDTNAGTKRWLLVNQLKKDVVIGQVHGEDNHLSYGQYDSIVTKFYVPNTVAVSKIRFASAGPYAAAKVKGLIYDDSSGLPNVRKAVSSELTGVLMGWRNDLSFASDPILTPGWYWFGIVSDTTMTLWGSGYGYLYYFNGTVLADYTNPSNPFGTATFHGNGMSLQILATEKLYL